MSTATTHAVRDDARRRRETDALGMWVFLATELMFFGPLFLGYVRERTTHGEAFIVAGSHAHAWLGTLNTAILLTSSLAMALAVRAANASDVRSERRLLAVTIALGLAFLAVKAYEYHAEWREGLVPVFHFTFSGPYAQAVEAFYYLYFVMTGLHAVHLAIGIGVLAWLSLRVRGRRSNAGSSAVEVAGLYWHFVDAVWVFLYPLFYLLGLNR